MNKIYLLAFVTLVGLSAFALTHYSSEHALRASLTAGADSFCPQPQYRADAWMNSFLTDISKIKYDNEMMTFIEA